MLNFMWVNYILHGFCALQNCPLPAVRMDAVGELKSSILNHRMSPFPAPIMMEVFGNETKEVDNEKASGENMEGDI